MILPMKLMKSYLNKVGIKMEIDYDLEIDIGVIACVINSIICSQTIAHLLYHEEHILIRMVRHAGHKKLQNFHKNRTCQ